MIFIDVAGVRLSSTSYDIIAWFLTPWYSDLKAESIREEYKYSVPKMLWQTASSKLNKSSNLYAKYRLLMLEDALKFLEEFRGAVSQSSAFNRFEHNLKKYLCIVTGKGACFIT